MNLSVQITALKWRMLDTARDAGHAIFGTMQWYDMGSDTIRIRFVLPEGKIVDFSFNCNDVYGDYEYTMARLKQKYPEWFEKKEGGD